MSRIDALVARNLGWSRAAAREALAVARTRSTAGRSIREPSSPPARSRST